MSEFTSNHIATCGHCVDEGISASIYYDSQSVSYGTYCDKCLVSYHKEGLLLNRELKIILDELTKLKEQNEKLRKCVSYYANTEIYNRPDKDRNGMGGMSSMTDFELDDGEWKLDNSGEKDHYCYGKLARKCLEEIDHDQALKQKEVNE